MSRHEIKFVYRRTEQVDSELEYIGGYNSDGSKWKLSVEKAIEGIEGGKWAFFLTKSGVQLDIMPKVINDSKKLCVDTSDFNYLEI